MTEFETISFREPNRTRTGIYQDTDNGNIVYIQKVNRKKMEGLLLICVGGKFKINQWKLLKSRRDSYPCLIGISLAELRSVIRDGVSDKESTKSRNCRKYFFKLVKEEFGKVWLD